MDILKITRARSKELAEYMEFVASGSLSFEGEQPLQHSSSNHVHLWKLEYLSDIYEWIDTEYKTEFINYIVEQWRIRLKGLAPYSNRGYRMYVYEDMAPTISVVAETDIGFPYQYGNPKFVNNIIDIVKLYDNRNWRENFSSADWEITQNELLKSIEINNGSISKPTANMLGLAAGKLRLLIINMGLGDEVNSIRKKYKRPIADFSNEKIYSESWHVFERFLDAKYH